MAVTVVHEGRHKRGKGSTVAEVLRSVDINPQNVLVSLEGRIVPDDMKVMEGQRLEALKVVSGG
jgi:sulfur carrier protein ThiS